PAHTYNHTLSLHDALPILPHLCIINAASTATTMPAPCEMRTSLIHGTHTAPLPRTLCPLSVTGSLLFGVFSSMSMNHSCMMHQRSEEHTSELQSPDHLVCR